MTVPAPRHKVDVQLISKLKSVITIATAAERSAEHNSTGLMQIRVADGSLFHVTSLQCPRSNHDVSPISCHCVSMCTHGLASQSPSCTSTATYPPCLGTQRNTVTHVAIEHQTNTHTIQHKLKTSMYCNSGPSQNVVIIIIIIIIIIKVGEGSPTGTERTCETDERLE